MKIVFDEGMLKKAYEYLFSLPDLENKEEEDYAQIPEMVRAVKEAMASEGNYVFGPSELPDPLAEMDMLVKRQGDLYEAYVNLYGRKGANCFDKFSNNLELENSFTGMEFIPTCLNGGGYLVKKNRVLEVNGIEYVLSHSKQKKAEVVSLVFGNRGSRLRSFNGYDNFLIDMKCLEEVTNCLVSRFCEFKGKDISRLDNIELLVS